jgi:hypothetical protein
LGSAFLFISCGDDHNRYLGTAGYQSYVAGYVPSAPYAAPRTYVRVIPRSHSYRYVYGQDRYSGWPSRYALDSYFGCRAYGRGGYYTGRYDCRFPYRYRHYEIVSRHLDCAMEECWYPHRTRGCRCLNRAISALPSDDPLVARLEEIRIASETADPTELEDLTMKALGDVALKMSPADSN